MNKKIIVLIIGFWMMAIQIAFTQTTFQKAYNIKAEGDSAIGTYDTYSHGALKVSQNQYISYGYHHPLGIIGQKPNRDGYLLSLDSLGNLQWAKGYGDNDTLIEEFNCATLQKNGDIIAVGKIQSLDLKYHRSFIVKASSINGDLIWSRKLGNDNQTDEMHSVTVDTNGFIYVLGGSGDENNYFTYIAKLDPQGNILWRKNYALANHPDDVLTFSSIVHLPTNELMVTGYSYVSQQGKSYGNILKINSDGGILWSKKYFSSDPNLVRYVPMQAYMLSTNDFMIHGHFGSDPVTNVIKINQNGELVWSTKSSYRLYQASFGSRLAISEDEQIFYMVSHTNNVSPIGNIRLSKFKMDGSHIWEKEYGGCEEDAPTSLLIGENSTVYISAMTQSYGGWYSGNTLYVIKVDSFGRTPCFSNDFELSTFSDFALTVSNHTLIPTDNPITSENYPIINNQLVYFDSLICSSLNPEKIDFKASDTLLPCLGMCVSFTDQSVMDKGVNLLECFVNKTDENNGIYTSMKLTYKWKFTEGSFTEGTDTMKNPTNVCYNKAGIFKVSLTVTQGCKQETKTIESYIHVIDSKPELTLSGDSSLCGGGTAQLVVSGAKTYSWLPTTGLNDPTNDTIIATPTQTTTYTVTGSLEENCVATKTMTIAVGNEVIANAGANDTICLGETISLSGTGGETVSWSTNQTTRDITVSPIATTDYIFKAIDGECDDADTVQVVVHEIPTVTITPENTTIEQGETVNLTATGGGNYTWSPTAGLSCSDCPTPIANPEMTTSYLLTVTNENGCMATKTVQINISYNCGELFIPNSFSPNGDNINDKLEVKINPDCVTEYEFLIFDRWGEKVFEGSSVSDKWDGKFNGKDLDNAVFVYYLKVKLIGSTKPIIKKGNVSIIK